MNISHGLPASAIGKRDNKAIIVTAFAGADLEAVPTAAQLLEAYSADDLVNPPLLSIHILLSNVKQHIYEFLYLLLKLKLRGQLITSLNQFNEHNRLKVNEAILTWAADLHEELEQEFLDIQDRLEIKTCLRTNQSTQKVARRYSELGI